MIVKFIGRMSDKDLVYWETGGISLTTVILITWKKSQKHNFFTKNASFILIIRLTNTVIHFLSRVHETTRK